jgi:O-antigen/teichoic acid export membrane protein
MKQFFRNGLQNKHFLSLTGNASMSGLAMLSFALLYRLLSVEEIGIWVFFQTAFTLADTFRSGFLNTSLITFYAGAAPARQREVVGSVWYLAGLITGTFALLIGSVGLFVPTAWLGDAALFFRWGAPTFVASLPTFMAACVVQAESRFDRFLLLRFVSQGLFILLLFGMLTFGDLTVERVAAVNLLATSLASAYVLLKRWTKLACWAEKTKACATELVHFGKYTFGSYLSSSLFRTFDVFLITYFLGPVALAVYNLGVRLMEIVEIPLRSFAATALPELSEAQQRQDRSGLVQTLLRYTGLLTVGLVPAGLGAVLLADVAIAIIGGAKYAGTPEGTQAATILRLYMLFALLYPADRFFAIAVDVIKQPRVNFYKVLAMLAASALGNGLGLYLTGSVYGALPGTFLAISIGATVGYRCLQNYAPFGWTQILRTGLSQARYLLSELPRRVAPRR